MNGKEEEVRRLQGLIRMQVEREIDSTRARAMWPRLLADTAPEVLVEALIRELSYGGWQKPARCCSCCRQVP